MQKLTRPLDEEEARVLGSLLEKEQTTPDLYPLTAAALLQACNQKTAREPVTSLSEGALHGALRELLNLGLAERAEGARATRFRHTLDLRLQLDPARKALLTLLILRGPQTPGELRSRSERMHPFTSTQEVEVALSTMAGDPEPLVRELERGPGQKESRWRHLLGRDSASPTPSLAVRRYAADEGEDLITRVADLNRRVRELERVVALMTNAREGGGPLDGRAVASVAGEGPAERQGGMPRS